MKNILIVILVPFMALANTINETQNECFENQINLDSNFENENDEHLLTYKFVDHTSTLTQVMGNSESKYKTSLLSKQIITNKIPRNLTTFSLAGMYDFEHVAAKPQKRLNSLLAANDPEFPKANTLHKDLKSVPAQKFIFNGFEYVAEGFGPRIKL